MIPERKWNRIAVSAFIIMNVAAISLTSNKPIQSFPEKLAGAYVYWARLFQQWALFVPNPRTSVKKYSVEILFRDGSVVRWHRPYPPNWDFFGRHLAYNFQKWDLAGNYLEKHSWIRQDLVNYVERLYHDPQNPPKVLKIISSTAPIPPPNESGYVQHDESEFIWRDEVLFEYAVR